MKSKTLKLVILASVFLIVFHPVLAQEEDTGDPSEDTGDPVGRFTLENPLRAETIPQLIDNLVKFIRDKLAPPLLVLMLLVGAFQMLFAGGSPERFKTGKLTILYSVVAYVIIWVASGITSIIQTILDG